MKFVILYNRLTEQYCIRSYAFWDSELRFVEKFIPVVVCPDLGRAREIKQELNERL